MVPGARLALLRIEQIAVLALVLRGFEGRRFLGVERLLPFEPCGALQGGDRAEGKGALYIRLAVWRPGRRPRPALALTCSRPWDEHGNRHEAERRYETSTVHLNPPRVGVTVTDSGTGRNTQDVWSACAACRAARPE